MSAAEILEHFRRLPLDERRKLVRVLADELDNDLTPEQVAELERRAQELRLHPEQGIPWETVRSELKERLQKSQS